MGYGLYVLAPERLGFIVTGTREDASHLAGDTCHQGVGSARFRRPLWNVRLVHLGVHRAFVTCATPLSSGDDGDAYKLSFISDKEKYICREKLTGFC